MHGMVLLGLEWQGSVRHGRVGQCGVGIGGVWFGKAGLGLVG